MNKPVYSRKRIYVYTFDRKLSLATAQRTEKIYSVAVGKPQTPTPHGTYQIVNKIINPGGILGSRWMGLSIPNGPYGIHGTSRPESIGKAISNGCIRMFNQDVEELFNMVSVGTTVIIKALAQDAENNHAYYKVKPGDTLWSISRRFGITVDELAKMNNISDPDNLQIGQELIVR